MLKIDGRHHGHPKVHTPVYRAIFFFTYLHYQLSTVMQIWTVKCFSLFRCTTESFMGFNQVHPYATRRACCTCCRDGFYHDDGEFFQRHRNRQLQRNTDLTFSLPNEVYSYTIYCKDCIHENFENNLLNQNLSACSHPPPFFRRSAQFQKIVMKKN